MFISFNLFVGLILLTIVMLALIVFLTFTGGPTKKEQHSKIVAQQGNYPNVHEFPEHSSQQPEHTIISEVPFLRDNQPETDPLEQNTPTYGGNDFYYVTPETKGTETEPPKEEDPFSILPYPQESPKSEQPEKQHKTQ